MFSIIKCMRFKSDEHKQQSSSRKFCQRLKRASRQQPCTDFKTFKDLQRAENQYQFKQIKLPITNQYSQQGLKRNQQRLGDLILKVKIYKTENDQGQMIPLGQLTNKYLIKLSQNIKLISYKEFQLSLKEDKESIMSINSQIGLNYLKFLIKYFSNGQLLDLFKNQYLYIVKEQFDKLGRIYIFNPQYMTYLKSNTLQTNIAKRLSQHIKDFFMLSNSQIIQMDQFEQIKEKNLESKILQALNTKLNLSEKKYLLLKDTLYILNSYSQKIQNYIDNYSNKLEYIMKEMFEILKKLLYNYEAQSVIAQTVQNYSQDIYFSNSSEGSKKKSAEFQDQKHSFDDEITQTNISAEVKRRSYDTKQFQQNRNIEFMSQIYQQSLFKKK